jgi:hypothetical protein
MAWQTPTERERTEDKLFEYLNVLLRLSEEESHRLKQLLEDYVSSRAEYLATQALDREFNRGDWQDD